MTTLLNYMNDTSGNISSLTIEAKSYMQSIYGIMFE